MVSKKVNLLEITVQTDIWVLLCTRCINNLSKATGKEKSILCIFSHINLSTAEKKKKQLTSASALCTTAKASCHLGKTKSGFAGFSWWNPCLAALRVCFWQTLKLGKKKNRNKNKNQSQATRHRHAEPSVAEPVLLLPTWSPLAVNCPLNISWCWISDASQDGSCR